MKDWISILIPVILVVGGFVLQSATLQSRVEAIEQDRLTAGKQALADLRSLEKRVYKIELQCSCAK